MSVNRQQYAKELEKALAKAKTLNEAHNYAAKKADLSKADSYHKPSWLDKVILKRLKARKAKKLKGRPTKKQQLKKAGVNWEKDKPSARLKGKK